MRDFFPIIIAITAITAIIILGCYVIDYCTSKGCQSKYTVEEYRNLLELAKKL